MPRMQHFACNYCFLPVNCRKVFRKFLTCFHLLWMLQEDLKIARISTDIWLPLKYVRIYGYGFAIFLFSKKETIFFEYLMQPFVAPVRMSLRLMKCMGSLGENVHIFCNACAALEIMVAKSSIWYTDGRTISNLDAWRNRISGNLSIHSYTYLFLLAGKVQHAFISFWFHAYVLWIGKLERYFVLIFFLKIWGTNFALPVAATTAVFCYALW